MSIQMELHKIIISDMQDQQIIVLKEVDGERKFPIVIGSTEANAISRRLKGEQAPRPMTHDLSHDRRDGPIRIGAPADVPTAVAAAKAVYAQPPSPATPALPLAAYAGRYFNDFVGDAVVSKTGDGLVLNLGPGGAQSYPLRHFDRDLFLAFPDAEMPDRPSAARFAIGPDGKASALTIEFLDEHGLGTLRRAAD